MALSVLLRQYTVLLCVPPVHGIEHVLQSPTCQLYVTHDCVLHAVDVAGLVIPAQYASGRSTPSDLRQVAVRVCVPPPQEAEQDPQVPVCQL